MVVIYIMCHLSIALEICETLLMWSAYLAIDYLCFIVATDTIK